VFNKIKNPKRNNWPIFNSSLQLEQEAKRFIMVRWLNSHSRSFKVINFSIIGERL